MKKNDETTFSRIGHAIDEMNDGQLEELLNSAQNILEDDKATAENMKEENIMGNNITAKALKAVLNLSDEERKALAPYITKSTQDLSDEYTFVCMKELDEKTEARNATINQLRDVPAAVWAAHTLIHTDSLVYDLNQILDAAKENLSEIDDFTNISGYYKMLLTAVEGIATKMLNTITSNSDYGDIMNCIVKVTDNPAE